MKNEESRLLGLRLLEGRLGSDRLSVQALGSVKLGFCFVFEKNWHAPLLPLVAEVDSKVMINGV